MTHLFKGAGVALITPFREDFSIDFVALEKLVEEHITSGTDYIVALGTTAETPTLSGNEKKEVIECIQSVINKRIPLVIGMGGNCTNDVVTAINNTDFNGIDGILSVTPYYNKPSQYGLIEHYKLVAKASPVPVIIYNVPSRTGVNMLAETSIQIAKACPNVIAIKEAGGEMSQITLLVKDKQKGFEVISGDDMLALPTVAVGGIGVISVIANALPTQLSKMVRLATEGKFSEAQKIHISLGRMFKLLFREGNPVGIKALMQITGKCTNVLRLPMHPASKELMKDLEDELKIVISG